MISVLLEVVSSRMTKPAGTMESLRFDEYENDVKENVLYFSLNFQYH